MRKFLLIVFLFSLNLTKAENIDPEKAEFIELVKERGKIFDTYSASLEKKSGFFGNRTKNDIRESQDLLMEVVRQDNKIMNMLNRRLGFRNFEKKSMADDFVAMQQKLINLNVVNDTLSKKLTESEEQTKIYRAKLNRQSVYLFLMIALFFVGVFFGWRYFRRRSVS
jgi:hypothetical protein